MVGGRGSFVALLYTQGGGSGPPKIARFSISIPHKPLHDHTTLLPIPPPLLLLHTLPPSSPPSLPFSLR